MNQVAWDRQQLGHAENSEDRVEILHISVLLIADGPLHIGLGRRYCTFVQKSETVSSP